MLRLGNVRCMFPHSRLWVKLVDPCPGVCQCRQENGRNTVQTCQTGTTIPATHPLTKGVLAP